MEPEWTNLSLLLNSIFSFTDDDKEEILGKFTKLDVGKNQILVRAGDVCEQFYFVNRGCLRTYFLTSTGQERTRLILPTFSIGTALTSFISGSKSFEVLDSIEKSTVLAISHVSFYDLVDRLPSWRTFYQKILEMAYIFQNTRIEHLISYSAAERFELLRRENPELLQVVPGWILASYLDIAPETLSRLRGFRT